ncbi:MAG: response regulator [Gammaproteobacteria bacterium]|nr:response regulator [Gammaproteobacteria bacterium]
MSEKPTILVVDDEDLNFDLVKSALRQNYQLDYVDNGEKCLAYLKDKLVDVVILDVKMPNMTGYEVCRRIKDTPETKDIPVIFVSGLDSIEERIEGYEAGGEDYLVKPFQPNELQKKVEVAVKLGKKLQSLKNNTSNATKAVMEALTNTGEIGVVLNFFTRSFRCDTYDDLADTLMKALQEYGLNSAVQIRIENNEYLDYDSSGVVRPLESTLLYKLKDAKRIYDFESRTAFNFPVMTVLIKNMPIDDSLKYGRYKDHLATLAEGAASRVQSLQNAISLSKQKVALVELLNNTHDAVEAISTAQEANKLEITQVFEALIIRVEEEFLTADLTEDQEKRLLRLVTDTSDRMNGIYDRGRAIEDRFHAITQQIERSLGADSKD